MFQFTRFIKVRGFPRRRFIHHRMHSEYNVSFCTTSFFFWTKASTKNWYLEFVWSLMRGGFEPPTIDLWVRGSTKLNYLICYPTKTPTFPREGGTVSSYGACYGGLRGGRFATASPLFFCLPKRNQHRLRRGLPGYLILFAPRAFAPQCQDCTRKLPSH